MTFIAVLKKKKENFFHEVCAMKKNADRYKLDLHNLFVLSVIYESLISDFCHQYN